MGYGDDFHYVAPGPIDQAERVERKYIAPSESSMARPCERLLGDGVHGMIELFAKSSATDTSRAAYQS
jgi:hypothetical protein